VSTSTHPVRDGHSAFTVHFSNPSPWLKLAPDPDTHWKFLGCGALVFKGDKLVLRGLRRRPDGSTVNQAAEIAMADVLNVIQEENIVRFDVRIPLSIEKPLQLWAADETAAQEIVARLPGQRTPGFVYTTPPQSYVTRVLLALRRLLARPPWRHKPAPARQRTPPCG
jgi:hypothetical protein